MSLIKNIIIFIIIFTLSPNQLSAQELKKVGKYKDWETWIIYDTNGKVCFAKSSPMIQTPKSKKREANLFVTFRPEENISNEVSVTPGYEFNNKNSVIASSGKNKFEFDNNYVVIKVEDIIPSSSLTFEKIKGSVISEYQSFLESNWIEKLRNKYLIKVDNQVLKELKKSLIK